MTELELLTEILESLHHIELGIGIFITTIVIWMWINR